MINVTFAISKYILLCQEMETSASSSRYLIFPTCLVTANAYGSNTQLHVTQNADMFANINHVDIQRTFDIREYRYDAVYFLVASRASIRCTCVERKKGAEIKSIFHEERHYFTFPPLKMHRLHLQYREAADLVLSRSEIMEDPTRKRPVSREI